MKTQKNLIGLHSGDALTMWLQSESLHYSSFPQTKYLLAKYNADTDDYELSCYFKLGNQWKIRRLIFGAYRGLHYAKLAGTEFLHKIRQDSLDYESDELTDIFIEGCRNELHP